MPLSPSDPPASEQGIKLEAPGDLLSGLLAVCEAAVLHLDAGGIRGLPAENGLWHIVALQSGQLRIALYDRTWDISADHVTAVIPAGTETSLLSPSGCSLISISVRGSAADAILGSSSRSSSGFPLLRGESGAGRVMRALSAQQRPVSALFASAQAYALLMALLEKANDTSAAAETTLPPVVEAAMGIIRREYAFLDSIADLSERLEVSQEYLTRVFRRYLGVTPGRWLNQVRVENAMRLLRNGGHTVRFVSDACGFSNSNYFARVFRACTGMAPGEYARRHVLSSAPRAEDDMFYVL